jgi:hypothetical protein
VFESTVADNFQGRTSQRGSAANFFLVLERQFKKEATFAHGIRGPSRSHHLLGASLPTSKDFQEKPASAEALPFFSWPRNTSTKKRPL